MNRRNTRNGKIIWLQISANKVKENALHFDGSLNIIMKKNSKWQKVMGKIIAENYNC